MGRKFLTAGSTTTPGLSSGCNGFPAPFRYSVTGNEELFPITFSLADLIRHFWGTKQWTVDTDLAVTAGADSCTLDSADLNFGIFNNVPAEATDQAELIYQGSVTPGFSSTFPHTDVGGGSASTSFQYFIDVLYGLAPSIYYDGADRYPQFLITLSVTVNDGGGNARTLFASTQPSSVPSPDGTIAATLDGTSFNLYYKTTLNVGTTSLTFTKLDLTPIPW